MKHQCITNANIYEQSIVHSFAAAIFRSLRMNYILIKQVFLKKLKQQFAVPIPLSFLAKKVNFIRPKTASLFSILFFVMAIFNQCTYQHGKGSDSIRLNQLGYYPNAVKVFVVADSNAESFVIRNIKGKEVFSGNLSESVLWEKSGENIRKGDFTNLSLPGKYQIVLNNDSLSHVFEIAGNIYEKANIDALKSYYFQRMSIPIEEKYAGIYHRAAGHPDTFCYYHPSTGYKSGGKASPGGWYDAGDYNKYVVNAGITLGFLMKVHELYPSSFPDNSLNIPESGNGRNDLLDEIRYELNWLLTMQDVDGGVFFKLTNLNFDDFVMPDKALEKRYFVGKSTTAALCFSAVTAQAARIYKKDDSTFAATLLNASEKAFAWAFKNPAIAYKNPSDVLTGEYGDNNFDDEFFWAAAELFVTTANLNYKILYSKYQKPFYFVPGNNWSAFLAALGNYSLIGASGLLPENEIKSIESGILKVADSLLNVIETVPYRIPVDHFTWGSNSDFLDAASVLAYAYKITNNKKYLLAVLETTDYIFGKNATSYSFLTGYGSKPVMNVHYRPSGADGIIDPIPGFLSGGPNNDKPDEGSEAWHIQYTLREPARSFLDDQRSFASNEVAINWNAPLVFVLNFIENEVAADN